MAHFIKAGFWKQQNLGLKGWLGLEQLIESLAVPPAWGAIEGNINNQEDLQEVLSEQYTDLYNSLSSIIIATPSYTSDFIQSPIYSDILSSFSDRVVLDGGTFENPSCKTELIQTLLNIEI